MKRRMLEPLLLCLAALLLFGSTLSRNLGASHDSITYINAIEHRSDSELFHPHHLLYHGLAKTWLLAARGAGVPSDSALVVAALNSLFGALCLLMLWLLLADRLRLARGPRITIVALAGGSYGFWFYSCCVEVYIVPLFFLLLSLLLASGPRLGSRRGALLGLTHGLAILFHQAHLLFTPVVLVAIAAQRYERRARWRPLCCYAGVGSLTVLLPYTIVLLAMFELDSLWSALTWLTSYAHIPNVSFWNPLALSTAFKAALGFSRAFVGGQFVFALPQLQERIRVAGKTLDDEAFLVRDLGEVEVYALLAACAIGLVLVLAALALAINHRGRLLPPRARVIDLVLVWLLVYCAFFFFWDSSNVEFWIPQSLCLWLLFAWLLFGDTHDAGARSPAALTLLAATLAALLMAVNFSGSIRFLREQRNDLYWQSIRPIVELARPTDLIVFGPEWYWREYYKRYASARTLCLEALSNHVPSAQFVSQVHQRIAATRRLGGRVLITEDAARFSYLDDDRRARQLAERVWGQLRGRWRTQPMPSVELPRPPIHLLE